MLMKYALLFFVLSSVVVPGNSGKNNQNGKEFAGKDEGKQLVVAGKNNDKQMVGGSSKNNRRKGPKNTHQALYEECISLDALGCLTRNSKMMGGCLSGCLQSISVGSTGQNHSIRWVRIRFQPGCLDVNPIGSTVR